ncbi:MAG: YCF48-related protein, partial [Ignavibacteriae bacterium]|nr:YCF48-related protein [Ignavibacteriota bacterium]
MKRIVKITIIFFFFITVKSYSQQYWLNLGYATTQNLWKCSFVDTSYGWAVGDSGTIVHTTNGGNTWITQDSKIQEYMISVFFTNRRLGWALAWGLDQNYFGTYILKTTNGGVTWDTARYPIPDTYIKTIYFTDSLTGYMGGGPAILLKTSDAGVNWISCSVDTTSFISRFPISRFRFYNSNDGIAMGGVMDIAGVFWMTTNAGLFWSASAIAAEPITDVHFFDSCNILAVGGDYEYGTSVLR